MAVVIATICMLVYIWFRFSDVRFAASAVLALLHDVLVVLTFYAIFKWSVGSTFIACMLTIVGYSINATIVIFDRIRENLKEMGNEEHHDHFFMTHPDTEWKSCISHAVKLGLGTDQYELMTI